MNQTYCEYLIFNGTTINGDADISGIGVLLAFTLSAYITFIITLLAYIFGHVERSLLNRVDIHILRIKPASPTRHNRVTIALRQAILAFSDQQIVTGIAILSAGFHGLQTGRITAYHFQIVLYLAWMSSSVHLSALGYLRGFLSRNKPLLLWRIVGMLVLMVLLFVGFVPTVSNDWGASQPWVLEDPPDYSPHPGITGWGVPASCFFGHLYGDGVNPDAVLSFLLLVVSYLWKAGGQFGGMRTGYTRYIRGPSEFVLESAIAYPAKRFARSNGWVKVFWLWAFRVAMAVYVPIDATIEMSASFSASIWLSMLGLVYGTMQIYIPRSQVLDLTGPTESGWGFGQLVPLILIIQPIGTIMEHVGAKIKGTRPARTDQITPTQTDLEFREVRRQSREYGAPLLHFLANFKPTPISERATEPSDLYPFLFESKVFAAQVWFYQLFILGTAVTIFYFDAYTIGFTTADNWYLIAFFIGGFLGATFLLMLCLIPFSRLGCQRSSLSPGPSIEVGKYQLRILAKERVNMGDKVT